MGCSDFDKGAVKASQRMMIISSNKNAANIRLIHHQRVFPNNGLLGGVGSVAGGNAGVSQGWGSPGKALA